MKHHKSLVGLLVGFIAIIGLLPERLHGEDELVEQFKFSGGIVVALDFDDGKFIADLATDGTFVIHALLSDEARVATARRVIQEAGVYGKVSCDGYNGRDLPYVDGLVNLVLCKESCEVSQAELMRVLVPGGRLVVEGASGWNKRAKPVPGGLDERNQFLHGADNNGVSLDDVGPPQRLRWHDTPEYGRSKALSPSFTNMVSADGVLMTIEDRATTEDINAPVDYHLVTRDGFNGIELWKRPMEQWREWQTGSIKSIPTQQQRCLAAVGRMVYVCSGFGDPVTALTIRTGAKRQVYEYTKRATEFAIDGKTLWTAPAGKDYMKSIEIFVADGLVWSRDLKGHDPKTGKVVRALTQQMTGPMSHDRCYRNRITHRYYLNSASGGADFVKLDGVAETPNPWARSTCGLAVMPANGMLYTSCRNCVSMQRRSGTALRLPTAVTSSA